jgi:hypothetical protein
MKYLVLTLSLFAGISAFGQVKVTQGSNSPQFALSKQPVFTSFGTNTADYFVIRRTEHMEKINTLITADKSGNLTSNEIHINKGVFNNMTEVNNLLVVGNTPVAFVENHNKDAGKNTYTARTIDNNGNVNATGVTVGAIDFIKMNNPGDWYAALTPDKKHVAVIAKAPYEKNQPEQFKYFILDETLKEVSKGQFSFAGNTKEIGVFNFLASDKGDLYIVSEDFDKTYKLPVLYKYSQGGQPMIIPVMMADPDLKNLSYTAKVNPAGDLVIAGYMQKRKTFTAGDVQATGTYLFNSAKPNEVKTFNFDKPVTNLTARNIIYNGDTFFLVGEQYKADKQQRSMGMGIPSAASAMSMLEAPYDYTHQDIMVTGFTNEFTKKFEMPLSRKWTAHEFDQDLMVASGIINNKLALVYNDEYGKYIDDKYRRYTKLPVAVLITNDGLMENPVTFANELAVKVSTYTLYPQFFSANNGRLVLLSGNAQSVKTNTFQ